MAKKTKKKDNLFGSIPPPEEFNAFPSIPFPDEMISSLTTPESKKDTPKDNAKSIHQRDTQNDKDKCHDQMTSPNDVSKQREKMAWHINEPPLLKTKNQKRLFNYLKQHGSMITTIGNLAKKTKISSRTVQRILTLFEDVGYIIKEKYINGDIQGIKIIVLERMKDEGKVSYNKRNKQHLTTSSEKDKKPPSEILIKETVLTLTQDDIKRFFLYLADAGFDSQQLHEIINCLKKLGKEL